MSIKHRVTAVVQRVARTPPRQLLRLMRPVRIDELLYVIADSGQRVTPPAGLVYERHTRDSPAGIPNIDRRLAPTKHAYVFRDGATLAHESWLSYDTLLPASFGFDSHVPVIGECATPPAYRGRHLYPTMLQLISQDVRQRGGPTEVYILVAPDNTASIKGIERAGSRFVARLTSFRIAGINFFGKQRTR